MTSKTMQKQKDKRLYREILNRMLELLDAGEYPAGGRLPPERELAERFEVSRPTMREAIIGLEVLNRVQIKTGSGIYVLGAEAGGNGASISVDAFELTEARALVEGEVAALAATMITDEQLRELEVVLHELADESKDGLLISEIADKKFHQLISCATRNAMLMSSVETLWHVRDHAPAVHNAYQSICETDGQKRFNEHKDIFEALKLRDASAARRAMHQHFSRILDKLIATREAEQVKEIRQQAQESRKRFSLNHLVAYN